MKEPTKLGTTDFLSFHYGNTLMKLAQTYMSLHEAMLEGVQNSIDSNATMVGITINKQKRSILIVDNGDGVSRAKFKACLYNTGSSVKDLTKLGRFGLGLISPLGKCRNFSFISCAREGNEGYQEWLFDTEEIAKHSKEIGIDCKKRPQYVFAENPKKAKVAPGQQAVNWRTCVRIRDYTEDRHISRIQSAEALKEAIIEKYGVAMRRNNVSVSVQIINENGTVENATGKAKRFSGKKLPEVVIADKDAGNTIFRMHLARKGTFGFRGKVLIGISNDDFRIPFATFSKEASGLLSDDIVELFKSGIFEGEIIVQNAKLHDSRKTFVNNDAYVGFCTTLETWFREHGKKYMKEIKEERQGQRIQDLSLKSLQNVEALLKDKAFERFRKDTIGSFKQGSVGPGHTAPDGHKVVGEQEDASISVQAAGTPRGENTGEEPRERAEPNAEKLGHAPFTATGPKGQNRTLVKGGSQGLQFDHGCMRSDGPPWVLDPRNGTIIFNSEHPDFLAASNAGDRELVQWQEIGAIMALVQYTMPEDYKKIAELFAGEVIAPLTFLIRNSPSFNLKARIKANKLEAR